MIIISNVMGSFPAEVISDSGNLAMLSLFISLSIYLLVSDSKYWNKCSSSTLDMCISSLFITAAINLIFKILIS